MKKTISFLVCLIISSALNAKKVKFAVDMTGQTVSPSGVHIVGDFQEMAGLGIDWDPATASMVKEGNTNIYSIVVSIPAFKKYEYRFVNGDLSYESEFIPEESRVGYNFVDNRWLYVDSLANDTTFAGAILYGGNAPAGKFLVRYKLNTNRMGIVPAAGFHVATSYQSFDPSKIRLYSFGGGIYEIISYVSSGTYGYKFFNGSTSASAETIPSSCAASGNRNLVHSRDTVLTAVCFAECLACLDVGIQENQSATEHLTVFPNPATGSVKLNTNLNGGYSVTLSDYTGKVILAQENTGNETELNLEGITKGIYLVRISNQQGLTKSSKLFVN